jgi:hypothetical protein
MPKKIRRLHENSVKVSQRASGYATPMSPLSFRNGPVENGELIEGIKIKIVSEVRFI